MRLKENQLIKLKSFQREVNSLVNRWLQRQAPDVELAGKFEKIEDIFKQVNEVEAMYSDWGKQHEMIGKTEILTRQLFRRFGQLPEWAESRISKAEPAQLENWADAVLDASNLTEILGTPDNQ